MTNLPNFLALTANFALGSAIATAADFDWPQWRGPNRDDVSKETGLLKEWPAGGPKKVWSFEKAGNGYAGVSTAAGKLFTMGIREGKEVLFALDTETGKELWATTMGNAFQGDKPSYKTDWGEGPRGTPTVDADRVYALGAWGSLVCASAKDGKVVWQKTMNDFGGEPFGWGFAESPLVDGAKLVCTPGGNKGTIVALDKMTGALVWQTKDFTDAVQYSSIIPANMNGTAQYLQVTMQSIVGINAKDGSALWRSEWPGSTAVIPTPIVRGNQVFATAGYSVGCKSFTVGTDNMLTELYRNKAMENHHGGVILVGDYVYGHSNYNKGMWTCLDFKTGEAKWQENELGKGSIACADGMLYLLGEKSGECVLIEASPEGWKEHGRFKLDPQSTIRSKKGGIWTHPVISNGHLYLRDQDLIHCYAVK